MIELSAEPLRIFFIVALVLTLISGVILAKYQHKLFGTDPTVPQETSGERFYTKTQMWICWLIALKLCITMVIIL